MGELVNLNRARKAGAKAKDKAQAAENRVRFGRTGAERSAQARAAERDRRDLDGKKRD